MILIFILFHVGDSNLAKSQSGGFLEGFKQRLENALRGPSGGGIFTPSNITFEEEKILANSSSFMAPPLSATSGNNVYVAWVEYSSTGSGSIMLRVSNDNGTTFSRPIVISDRVGLTDTPILISSGNNVYVAWVEYSSTGSGSIMLRVSNDNGVTFKKPSMITNNLSSPAFPPILAAFGSNVYVAWLDESYPISELRLKSSTNGGASFSDSITIASQNILSLPIVATSHSNVYLLWSDMVPGNSRIYFKASNNNGSTFGETIILATKSRFTNPPIIETSGRNVYVTWQDGQPDNLKLFLINSNNNGTSFNHSFVLAERTIMDVSFLSASENNVYIGWIDARLGGNNTFIVRNSNDNGIHFDNAKTIANRIGVRNVPSLESYKDNIFLTWLNNSGLSIKSSENGGRSFDKAILLNSPSVQSDLVIPTFSSISTAENKLYVCLEEVHISPKGITNLISFRIGTISTH